MRNVPAFDYLKQYRRLENEMLEGVQRVFTSGSLILGPELEAFEEEFSHFLGGGSCVGVGNGTDAITLLLRAMGIGAGDEVITVPNTAVPTVSAICEVGATPVFCDVDPETSLMDVNLVPACLTERTRAVMPVHLYGNVVNIHQLREVLDRPDILILEDCAQSHGASLETGEGTVMTGLLGDAAAFSFYPTKNIGAYGDAGLCVTQDPELAETLRSLRMYGFKDRYYSEREGVNTRLDEIQAAILRVKLKHYGDMLQRRRAIARLYDAQLSDAIPRRTATPASNHAYHHYVISLPNRDDARAKLKEIGIGTGIHYPFPIHCMKAYQRLGYQPGDFPVAERLAEEILSLPMYPELTDEDIDYVCEGLNRIVSE